MPNLEKALTHFCDINDVSDVRIVMVDKDMNEMNVIKSKIPHASCECIKHANFALPCRHIFACRKMKEMPVYDDELIPNRWRKEFEPAEDKEIPDIIVTSAQVTKRKNNKASEPKTVIEKLNKAMEVCRDMATFFIHMWTEGIR